MEVDPQTGVPDGWEVVSAPAQTVPAAAGGHWEDRPMGGQAWKPDRPAGERTRTDTNILRVNHEQIQHRIADWASKLPEPYQRPAAILAGLPAHILGSLVESLSAPETVATMGAKPAMAAMDKIGDAVSAAAGKVASAVSTPVRVGKALVTDPDVVGTVSPRVGNALRVAQRLSKGVRAAQAKVAADDAAQATADQLAQSPAAVAGRQLPSPSELSPLELTRAMKEANQAQAAPTTIWSPQRLRNEIGIATRRTGVTLTGEQEAAAGELIKGGTSAVDAVKSVAGPLKETLTAGEAKLVDAMSRAGRSDAEIQAALKAARDFNTKFGLKTPTAAETRFPKGMRGKIQPIQDLR